MYCLQGRSALDYSLLPTLTCRRRPRTQAHVNWGMALKALHKRPQAIEHYKMALDLDASCADAHVRWGNVLLEQWMEHHHSTPQSGNALFSEAILHFKKALHIDPHYVGLSTRLDSLLAYKKDSSAEDRDPYHQQQQEQEQQKQYGMTV